MFKSHKYIRNFSCLTFWFMDVLLKAYFRKNKFQKKISWNFFRSGSRYLQKSDLVKNRLDPQHLFQWIICHIWALTYLLPDAVVTYVENRYPGEAAWGLRHVGWGLGGRHQVISQLYWHQLAWRTESKNHGQEEPFKQHRHVD
jgi:hypothetical protein